jgi:hypothetical protein
VVVSRGVHRRADADRAAWKSKYDWDMPDEPGPLWAVRLTGVFAFSAGGDFAGIATFWVYG